MSTSAPVATAPTYAVLDGNAAAAHVAYAFSEVMAIYPITPSTPIGEQADAWMSTERPNLWGTVPSVTEMQSEGGAAGAVHGAVMTGALSSTFTASQGLLLMIPNMYKIAGELTPAVFHVTARAIAAQGLSIFGDHSDVMACRATGWAMLSASGVQETTDMAAVAHAATLASRIPFIHFFDGFRTSHELQRSALLSDDDLRCLFDEQWVLNHRSRSLNPNKPSIRGTAQNPDVYFQGRETVNPFYQAVPDIVQTAMDALADRTGRAYHLFDYVGADDATSVVVVMGSGADVVRDYIQHCVVDGDRIGMIEVRLFRPFSRQHLIAALPTTTQMITVLDRTKEPGSAGEPLYQDVITSLMEAHSSGEWSQPLPRVLGGRYGLGSKEFDPAMVHAIFHNAGLAPGDGTAPKNHFTVGITDDVAHTSLTVDRSFRLPDPDVRTALFVGLGSDGTVGANKNSIKIIGDATGKYAQGYFVYDSKKSGSMTISHLRFSDQPIASRYLIDQAEFIAVHHWPFLLRYDFTQQLKPGGTMLVNCPIPPEELWDQLPAAIQTGLIAKEATLYTIAAGDIARKLGLGNRTNVIMQTAYFQISGVLPAQQATDLIATAVKKTYASKGPRVVTMNLQAMQAAMEAVTAVPLGTSNNTTPLVGCCAPERSSTFIADTVIPLINMQGDELPVSAIPADGVWPTATAQLEKRGIANAIPVWDSATCIQCNQCTFVCPHAAIRAKICDDAALNDAPDGFVSVAAKGRKLVDKSFMIQVSPQDCTGCELCVETCPAFKKDETGAKTDRRAINMAPLVDHLEQEQTNWDYFNQLPACSPEAVNLSRATPKGSQLVEPLFEYSGACSGCGETPYLKLLSQLYGDRLLIANATGCSSIYGGNLPTTPWTQRADGCGPAWANSLFEDNAEFGLGMRLTSDKMTEEATRLVQQSNLPAKIIAELLTAECTDQPSIEAQRQRIAEARDICDDPRLISIIDHLLPRSHWIVGGDGWAYDIGFGGLDHVMASGADVNVLILDTGVYSNTGGQASKATPRGAVAKFAAGGKQMGKKDLGAIAMSYQSVYVAQIAFGASMPQTVKALSEAASYPGPSVVIAYSNCIAHGINLAKGNDIHKQAVATGFWPLYRFDPRRDKPMQLDSKTPTGDLGAFLYQQNRFRVLKQSRPAEADRLLEAISQDVAQRWQQHEQLAQAGC